MSKKGKPNNVFLMIYILAVVGTSLGYFVSMWFYFISVYSLSHLFFGPLDWYYIYRLYKWLKER